MKKETNNTVLRFANNAAEERSGMVSVCMNSMYYYLDWAFVLVQDDGYRLLVQRGGTISTDCLYSTLKGAKGAFYLSYKNMACVDEIKPHWSGRYIPDAKWLDKHVAK